MEELFNGQLSFADIEAEKFLQIRRTHADRRVNAMDRLTDDVINELIQLCLPLYHIKANHGRPYTRLETMVRVHLLQVSLNLSDLEMESYFHIWRATWWPVASVACLARISSSQIRRYCASGISLSNRVGAKITRAHGKSGRRSRGLLF